MCRIGRTMHFHYGRESSRYIDNTLIAEICFILPHLLTANSWRFSGGIVSRTGLKTTSSRSLSFKAIHKWNATKFGLSAKRKMK